jgi:apolipoprotein N-acyltransferase
VSFLVACVNAGVAELALARAGEARRAGIGLGLAVLLAVGSAGIGAAVLRGADEGAFPGPATKVAVVQGNMTVDSRWRRELYGANLEVYMRLTAEAVRESPRIAFWPESAMTFFLEDEPLYQRSLASLLAGTDLELVAGAPRKAEDGETRYFNTIYSLATDARVRGRYDKQYLVPFSEYFPFDVDLLRRRFGRVRAFEHGAGDGLLPTRAGPAGVVVCNEAMLPEVVAARVDAGAVYLVNPSNDTWITDPQYVEQQLDIAIVRAIEQRRYLVRASTGGPSGVVDPWGRVQVATRAQEREVVMGEIRPSQARTLYGRLGDLFALVCTGLALAAWARAVVQKRHFSGGPAARE